MLDPAAFKRWRKFLVEFKANGYKSKYTSQPIEKFVGEIILDGEPLPDDDDDNFTAYIKKLERDEYEEERKICTKFLLLFVPTWVSLRGNILGPNSMSSSKTYLFDLEFEWEDWDLDSVFGLVDRASLSNPSLGAMVLLRHKKMYANMRESESSLIFNKVVLEPLNELLNKYADIEMHIQEPIPPDSSGNVTDGPKTLVAATIPDVAYTLPTRHPTGAGEEEGAGDTKKRKTRGGEEGAGDSKKRKRRAGEEEEEQPDGIFFKVMEFKRHPLHKSLYEAFRQNKNPKDKGMGVFHGKYSPFQQLGLQIMASKSFGGVLTDSFHAFITEINLRKLKEGIKYKEENGVDIPVLPLVVKYVNMRSQSPSLPLSFASTSIDWIERTRNELPENESWRLACLQDLLAAGQRAAKNVFKHDEGPGNTEGDNQPDTNKYPGNTEGDSQPDTNKDDGKGPGKDASFDQNPEGGNQSDTTANDSQRTEPQGDDDRSKKRTEVNPKDNYSLADNTEPINPYDITMDSSVASHEDRPDKIPLVFVDPDDVTEAHVFENSYIFKVKARALMEAIIPEDRVGLGDEDILVVKVVRIPDGGMPLYDSKDIAQKMETDRENAFIDQILPYIPGFNNCYLRHRAIDIRIFGDGPYTGHFILSRYIENKAVPLETIKDKVEEQKRILRNGSVEHYDLEERNILYDGEKVYIIDFGLARHHYHESTAKPLSEWLV